MCAKRKPSSSHHYQFKKYSSVMHNSNMYYCFDLYFITKSRPPCLASQSGPTDLRHFDPEFTHMPVPASLCNDSLMVTSSVKEAAGAFPGFSYGAPSGQAFM